MPFPHDDAIAAFALRLGFDRVGFARADVPLQADHERYLSFLKEGKHGDMKYLAKHGEVRARLDHPGILPGAKSVIVVAMNYRRKEEADDPPIAHTIARYARGGDYHNFMKKKLVRLAKFVKRRVPGVEARAFVDAAPILERAWAARAGLGFVGKNGLLIIPGLGSMVLLGEVITTLELLPGTPIEERCGSCTRCLDACPTSAFDAPFVLDPRRCIAYLTIESRSAPPEALRPKIGNHLFGCDDCQTACPFNQSIRDDAFRKVPGPFAPRHEATTLEDLLSMSEDEPRLSGSPLSRAGMNGLARNALIVLKNRGAVPETAKALAADHPDASVREVAAWATN